MTCRSFRVVAALCHALAPLAMGAAEAPPPVLTNLSLAPAQRSLRFPPYPAAQSYTFLSATNLAEALAENTNFFLAPYVSGYSTNQTTNGPVVTPRYGYEWRLTNGAPTEFYQLAITPLESNRALAATALNRLAYGPTPDELERVGENGQAYIDEQLNMQGLTETMDAYVVQTTNGFSFDPTTNWVFTSVTGRLSGSTLYLYLTRPGDVYLDDLKLVEGTDPAGTNVLIAGGDFESGLTPPWTLSGSVSNSSLSTAFAHSGSNSLHLVAATAGSTAGNNLRQVFTTSLTNNSAVTLSYWYLPGPTSSRFKAQLPGSGLISSAGGIPSPPTWVYAQATGTATATARIYTFLSSAGDCYLDDLQLVAGPVAGAGPNLLQNGDFESGSTVPWQFTADFTNSVVSSTLTHSGSGSLHLVATGAGAGSGDAVFQDIPGLVNGATYTVSYWYRPAQPGANLTVRLSGSLLTSTPDTDNSGLARRLNTGTAGLSDYRAWFCQHAVRANRQLLEVLSQFWENHFVTQQSKSREYLTGFGFDGTTAGRLATDWEYREMTKWRNVMLDPAGTFYDLLKISTESPAMIVYLDTVNSKGNANNIANENYARELLELFGFGVDNGYDQNDIVLMSRAWTGWSVEVVDAENLNNPFAPVSVTLNPGSGSTAKANLVGVWTFNYKSGNHGTNRGALFQGRTVPARLGPPWAGRNYQLTIPSRTGTNGIQDGYDVIAHLADQPFTQEFISIKLCRLFVHDEFPNPSTDPSLPEYAFYDYTDPNRSAEAELVHQCMLAWENSNPKGQIRAVLNAIFNSELFRSQAAAGHKVKTPLEFVASSLRALYSPNADGTATATTDGYAFASPLNRMGQMNLFDRDAPDGYPEAAPRWISAGTVVERIRFLQAYCIASGGSGRADAGNNFCNPVALLKKKSPPASWDNATQVADYFANLLYPGEGSGNLALYRAAAVNFLNTADDGVTVSLFSGLGNATTTYDTRVRGMVAMLMTFQRFQEQ